MLLGTMLGYFKFASCLDWNGVSQLNPLHPLGCTKMPDNKRLLPYTQYTRHSISQPSPCPFPRRESRMTSPTGNILYHGDGNTLLPLQYQYLRCLAFANRHIGRQIQLLLNERFSFVSTLHSAHTTPTYWFRSFPVAVTVEVAQLFWHLIRTWFDLTAKITNTDCNTYPFNFKTKKTCVESTHCFVFIAAGCSVWFSLFISE